MIWIQSLPKAVLLPKKKKQFYINNIPNQSNQLNQLIPSTSIDQSFT